jgi:hypothetical protein
MDADNVLFLNRRSSALIGGCPFFREAKAYSRLIPWN